MRAVGETRPFETGTSGRTSGPATPFGDRLSGSAEDDLVVRRGDARLVLPPLLGFQPDLNSTNPAVREEIKRIVGLLAAARRGRLPHRRGAVSDRKADARSKEQPPRLRVSAASCAGRCSGSAAMRSCSARRTSPARRRRVFLRRRRPAHDLQLLGQPASVPRARDRRRAPAARCAPRDRRNPARRRPVGELPPQPR